MDCNLESCEVKEPVIYRQFVLPLFYVFYGSG